MEPHNSRSDDNNHLVCWFLVGAVEITPSRQCRVVVGAFHCASRSMSTKWDTFFFPSGRGPGYPGTADRSCHSVPSPVCIVVAVSKKARPTIDRASRLCLWHGRSSTAGGGAKKEVGLLPWQRPRSVVVVVNEENEHYKQVCRRGSESTVKDFAFGPASSPAGLS